MLPSLEEPIESVRDHFSGLVESGRATPGASRPTRILGHVKALPRPGYVRISCPSCGGGLKARDEFLGRRIRCKHCEHPFRARTMDDSGRSSPADAGRPTGADVIRAACPKCCRELRIGKRHMGRRVSCKRCNHVFRAPEAPDRPSGAPSSERLPLDGSSSFLAQMPEHAIHALLAGFRRTERNEQVVFGPEPDETQAMPVLSLADASSEPPAPREQARAVDREEATLRQELAEARAEIVGFRAQLEAIQERAGEADREELPDARSEPDARLVDDAQLARLIEDLKAARVERDQLADHVDEQAHQLEQVQVEIARLHRALEDARVDHDATQANLARTLEEARRRWEAQRQALIDQIDRRDREADSLRQERDDARRETGDRAQDATSRLTSRIREIEAAGVEAQRRHELDLERLNQALERARQQAADVTRQRDELALKLRELENQAQRGEALARDRLESEQRRWDRDRAALQASIEDLTVRNGSLGDERDDLLRQVEAADRQCDELFASREEILHEAQEAERRHEHELSRLREALEAARDEAIAGPPQADPPSPVAPDAACADGQLEELTRELHRTRRENEQLLSLLSGLGIDYQCCLYQ